MPNYSYQDCVDRIFPSGPFGWVVDIGANDGSFQSWSLPLEKQGWDVLCIEGNPAYASDLQGRKNSVIAAVAAEDGVEADFYIHSAKPASYSGLIQHGKQNTSVRVTTKTLTTCLLEHHIEKLSILGMDMEGGELGALQGLDFDRWQPRLIFCEHHFKGYYPKVADLLRELGYVDFAVVGEDTAFRRKNA